MQFFHIQNVSSGQRCYFSGHWMSFVPFCLPVPDQFPCYPVPFSNVSFLGSLPAHPPASVTVWWAGNYGELLQSWGQSQAVWRLEAGWHGPDSRMAGYLAFTSTVLARKTTVLVTVQQSSWGVPAVGTKVCFPLQSMGQEPLLLCSPGESGTSPGRNHQFSSPPTKQKELNLS